jgi:predicted nucleic acid-binding protein
MRSIVIFFDTNLLVYSTANLDEKKQEISDNLIETAIKDKVFVVSPLVLSEFIFVLAKLKIDRILVDQAISSYKPFVKYPLEAAMVLDAYDLCKELELCHNINDAIHLKYAERHCSKIVTFDRDFRKFEDSTETMIEILTTVEEKIEEAKT